MSDLGISLKHVRPHPEFQAQKRPSHVSVSIQKDGNSKSLKYHEYMKYDFPGNCGEHGEKE